MKYKICFAGAIAVICLFTCNAFSQSKKKITRAACGNFGTQAEANECARREYEAANREMNEIYQSLLTALGEGSNGEQDQLKQKAAQAQWLKYRDAECESEASIYKGGTMQPAIYNRCLAAVSRERTKRLKAFLAETKQ
jgi:uncharacterized protein YecT (DUF1311 family)